MDESTPVTQQQGDMIYRQVLANAKTLTAVIWLQAAMLVALVVLWLK